MGGSGSVVYNPAVVRRREGEATGGKRRVSSLGHSSSGPDSEGSSSHEPPSSLSRQPPNRRLAAGMSAERLEGILEQAEEEYPIPDLHAPSTTRAVDPATVDPALLVAVDRTTRPSQGFGIPRDAVTNEIHSVVETQQQGLEQVNDPDDSEWQSLDTEMEDSDPMDPADVGASDQLGPSLSEESLASMVEFAENMDLGTLDDFPAFPDDDPTPRPSRAGQYDEVDSDDGLTMAAPARRAPSTRAGSRPTQRPRTKPTANRRRSSSNTNLQNMGSSSSSTAPVPRARTRRPTTTTRTGSVHRPSESMNTFAATPALEPSDTVVRAAAHARRAEDEDVRMAFAEATEAIAVPLSSPRNWEAVRAGEEVHVWPEEVSRRRRLRRRRRAGVGSEAGAWEGDEDEGARAETAIRVGSDDDEEMEDIEGQAEGGEQVGRRTSGTVTDSEAEGQGGVRLGEQRRDGGGAQEDPGMRASDMHPGYPPLF